MGLPIEVNFYILEFAENVLRVECLLDIFFCQNNSRSREGEPSIFIEDVETAPPQVVNREFEQEHFGHRALIHARLSQDKQLWGILELSVFGQPRHWSEFDRQAIAQSVEKMTPLAIAYIEQTRCC